MLVLLLVLVLDPMRTRFDHEELNGYRLQLQFVAWAGDLLDEVNAGSRRPRLAEVVDQLDRASLSMLLNTAEGNGKRHRQVRAKFFDDARGSATECAACPDALVAKKACAVERIAEGKQLLLRIYSIMTKLVQTFDPGEFGLREEPVAYRVEG